MEEKEKIFLSKEELKNQKHKMKEVIFDFWCMFLASFLGHEYYDEHGKGKERLFCLRDNEFKSADGEILNPPLEDKKPKTKAFDLSPRNVGVSVESSRPRDAHNPPSSLSILKGSLETSDGMEREKAAKRILSKELNNHIGLHAIVALYSTWEVFLKDVLSDNGVPDCDITSAMLKEAKKSDLVNELRIIRNCIAHASRDKDNLPVAKSNQWFSENTSPILKIERNKSIQLTCQHLEKLLNVIDVALDKWYGDRCEER